MKKNNAATNRLFDLAIGDIFRHPNRKTEWTIINSEPCVGNYTIKGKLLTVLTDGGAYRHRFAWETDDADVVAILRRVPDCKHPPTRQFWWAVDDLVTGKRVMCGGCSDCGAVLAGAVETAAAKDGE